MGMPRSMFPPKPAPLPVVVERRPKLRLFKRAPGESSMRQFIGARSVAGIAQTVGLSHRGVTKILTGESLPRVDHFYAIARALKVSPATFWVYLQKVKKERADDIAEERAASTTPSTIQGSR
jgi:transcriptional regulator with XRE-family HTH domain